MRNTSSRVGPAARALSASRRRERLDRALDIGLAAAALAAVSLLGLMVLRPAPRAPASRGEMFVGGALPPLATASGRDFVVRGPALILVFKSTCPYCEITAPRWRELASAFRGRGSVIAVSSEGNGAARRWLRAHAITPDSLIIGRASDSWAIPGVPVTILTDRDGHVTRFVLGILAAREVQDFLRWARSAGPPLDRNQEGV